METSTFGMYQQSLDHQKTLLELQCNRQYPCQIGFSKQYVLCCGCLYQQWINFNLHRFTTFEAMPPQIRIKPNTIEIHPEGCAFHIDGA